MFGWVGGAVLSEGGEHGWGGLGNGGFAAGTLRAAYRLPGSGDGITLHTLTPSHPHTFTHPHPHPHPHIVSVSLPYILALTPLHSHILTSSHPHTLTPSQEMYSALRKDGHKLVELLRKPVGESR